MKFIIFMYMAIINDSVVFWYNNYITLTNYCDEKYIATKRSPKKFDRLRGGEHEAHAYPKDQSICLSIKDNNLERLGESKK